MDSSYQEEVYDKVIKTAMRMFLIRGVKAVRMDDIAHHLHISKRTIYEVCGDKVSILREGLRRHNDDFRSQMQFFERSGHYTVIDTIIKFYTLQTQYVRDVNPQFYADVHKYPEMLKMLNKMHQDQKQTSAAFFDRGIREGLFRPDINYKLATSIGDIAMQQIMETQLYKTYSLRQIMDSYVMVVVRGFCTEKGVALLDKAMKAMR